jgi:hypothetical protein
MKRKAMMAMNDHAKNVCTTHRWRVAWRMVAEIHHPRMRAARVKSLKRRKRLLFLKNHEGSFKLTSASPFRRGMIRSSVESESVDDFFSEICSCTRLPIDSILNVYIFTVIGGKKRQRRPRGEGKGTGEELADKEESDSRRKHSQLYRRSWHGFSVASIRRRKLNKVLVDFHCRPY